jgi:hypothetical protein
LREAGLGTDMMDNLDEKPFTLQEIREFCIEFFLGNNPLQIRNPKVDVYGFFEDLQSIVEREKFVWNPVKNKLYPWIDVEKLKLMTFKKTTPSNVSSRRASDPFSSSIAHIPPQASSNGKRPEQIKLSHANIRRQTEPFPSSFQAPSSGKGYEQFDRR